VYEERDFWNLESKWHQIYSETKAKSYSTQVGERPGNGAVIFPKQSSRETPRLSMVTRTNISSKTSCRMEKAAVCCASVAQS
jgi:hypothetical protein